VNDDWTTVEELLSGLPRATPDAARATHVRERCHRKLPRRRLRASRYGSQAPLIPALESAVVGGFCAVYLSLLALIALHTHGLL
jgi:hypothetical protein